MADRKPTLTVRQVIEELQKIENQDLPVLAEGCDCINPVIRVTLENHGGVAGNGEVVLIEVMP